MMRTIPVARMATLVAWTARVTMLTGRKNLPSVRRLKASRMAARAMSIPNRRMSISVLVTSPRTRARTLPSRPMASRSGEPAELRALPGTGDVSATSAMAASSWCLPEKHLRPRIDRGRR
jgi:hypothetical protein